MVLEVEVMAKMTTKAMGRLVGAKLSFTKSTMNTSTPPLIRKEYSGTFEVATTFFSLI